MTSASRDAPPASAASIPASALAIARHSTRTLTDASLPASSVSPTARPMDLSPPSRSSPIPTPARSPRQQPFFDDDLSRFVGSPDSRPTPSFLHAPRTPPSSQNIPHENRPSFRRALSASLSFNQRRHDTVSRVQELASSFSRNSRLAQSDHPPHHPEWSLFAELISQESPLPNASSTSTPATTVRARTLFPSPRSARDTRGSYFDPAPSSNGVLDSFHSEHSRRPSNLPSPSSPSPPPPDYASTRASTDDSSILANSDHARHSSARSVSTQTKWYSPSRIPPLPPLYRNILKCCVAYFIGSLFTFSPYLSGFIADITGGDPGDRIPSPSGHMVATM